MPTPSVNGPFPLLPKSEVQTSASPALKPTPFQLHNAAGHSIASKLFGPASDTVMLRPLSEVAMKLPPSTVASVPSCDQWTKSFAFWAPILVTASIESARQIGVANRLASIKPKSPARTEYPGPRPARRSRGSLFCPPAISYMQTPPASLVNFPLSENQPFTPSEGVE